MLKLLATWLSVIKYFANIHSVANTHVLYACHWQLFCQTQIGRPRSWLRKSSHLNKTMVIVSSAASFMNKVLSMRLCSYLCIYINAWKPCVNVWYVIESVVKGYFFLFFWGNKSRVHENTFLVSQRGSCHACGVLQDFTLRTSASQYSTSFRLLWTLVCECLHFDIQQNTEFVKKK